jgi:hypothetical protein
MSVRKLSTSERIVAEMAETALIQVTKSISGHSQFEDVPVALTSMNKKEL